MNQEIRMSGIDTDKRQNESVDSDVVQNPGIPADVLALTRAQRLYITWLCFIVVFFVAAAMTMLGPLLLGIRHEFSLTLGQSGLLVASQYLGFTIFIFISGYIADKIGKKAVILISLAMLTIAASLFSLTNSFVVSCLLIAFVGGGLGILETMGNALAADVNPHKKVFYINFVQVFFGLGAIVGPLFSGLMLSGSFTWRNVYLVISLAFLVNLILFVFARIPGVEDHEKIQLAQVKNLLGDYRFILLCLAMVFYTGSEGASWNFMSSFTVERYSFSTFESGAAVALLWIAITVSRFIVIFAISKVDPRKLVIFLAAATAVISIAMGLVNSRQLVWPTIALLGLFYSSQWSLILSYCSIHYPKYSSTVFSLMVGSGGIGMSLIPILSGYIGDWFGIQISVAVPAIFFMGIALIFSRIHRMLEKG
jgi:fucose permease